MLQAVLSEIDAAIEEKNAEVDELTDAREIIAPLAEDRVDRTQIQGGPRRLDPVQSLQIEPGGVA